MEYKKKQIILLTNNVYIITTYYVNIMYLLICFKKGVDLIWQ
jgi:hypothetical protein